MPEIWITDTTVIERKLWAWIDEKFARKLYKGKVKEKSNLIPFKNN